MIKLKPPTHTIDGLAVFVSSTDPAWDVPRIEAEREARLHREALRRLPASEDCDHVNGALDAVPAAWCDCFKAELEKLLPAERAEAISSAPVERYYAGRTRFQLDAPDWAADGSPTTARAYLKPGQKPAEFGLRRLGFRDFQAVVEIENSRARLVEACRLGLRSIKADGYSWRAKDDEPAGDEQLEVLHGASPALVTEIGVAVLALSRPLDPEAETPRSGSSRIASA